MMSRLARMIHEGTVAKAWVALLTIALVSCLSSSIESAGGQDASDAVTTDSAPGDTGDEGVTPDVEIPDVATDPVTDTADQSVDSPTDDGDAPRDAADDGDGDAGELRGSGTWADPYVITSVPFTHSDDTTLSTQDTANSYACAPTTSEAGPEVVYRIRLGSAEGVLSAAIDELPGDSVDVDVHLLASTDPSDCLDRGNSVAYHVLREGDDPYLSIDSWTNSGGTEFPGAYTLEVDLAALPAGDCHLEIGEIDLINRDDPLPMPAIGEVVREAHLVTTEEFANNTWPTSSTDGIPAHYARSQEVSGYVMDRSEPWAPEGEGGSMWGQGSTSRPPPLEETWYVNMYWTGQSRPAQGTRMLVWNPVNGRAVVAAGGYETGPGSNLRIGGATEEILDHVEGTHRSKLLMGFLTDQELVYGPIDCD